MYAVLYTVQGRDTSVRDASSQGHSVQDIIVQGKTFRTLWSGIHELDLKPDAEARVKLFFWEGGRSGVSFSLQSVPRKKDDLSYTPLRSSLVAIIFSEPAGFNSPAV
jgi:hypothetical protein